ncbi:SDR family oxidoreductase [Alkalihalobacillus sp. MEB130]|uniref:SDR family oxidoreductase n=1 Tax=Alkalihalobacillus sp. MEB130 TaxID=2976704 RepID=UPI0028DF19E5|nr:SDR family oxidoreductase [Alkalihalobacillus sp. MEB130]MDT8860386.1 SDR family oxidoreductase [Alkalihalobacillus sp. MEB130]
MRKIAIITGASSGFGLLTTVELAKQGFFVLATMRSVEKAVAFNAILDDQEILERIEPFPLDVIEADSIARFSKKVQSLEQVDVLINNAGFAMGGFAEEIDASDYKRQFETNVFGVMAVTQAVLPVMRKQRSGKIINISSVSGRIGFPGLSPYASSKHALEGYSESLRLEVKPFGIDVALVEPGSYQTNIWSTGMEVAGHSEEKDSAYEEYMQAITRNLEVGKKKHGDPAEVAKLIVDLASRETIKRLRYPIGRGLKLMLLVKQLMPWSMWEKIVLGQVFKKKL